MALQYTLRKATESDIGWLIELRSRTMDQHMIASGLVPDPDTHRSRVMHAFGDIEIVQIDSTDIGMVKVEKMPEVWRVVQIQIVPELQGRGIGTLILRQVLEEAGNVGRPVTLNVLKSNPAVHLYERLGFGVVLEKERAFVMRVEASKPDASESP